MEILIKNLCFCQKQWYHCTQNYSFIIPARKKREKKQLLLKNSFEIHIVLLFGNCAIFFFVHLITSQRHSFGAYVKRMRKEQKKNYWTMASCFSPPLNDLIGLFCHQRYLCNCRIVRSLFILTYLYSSIQRLGRIIFNWTKMYFLFFFRPLLASLLLWLIIYSGQNENCHFRMEKERKKSFFINVW